jgi:hypothetical protein
MRPGGGGHAAGEARPLSRACDDEPSPLRLCVRACACECVHGQDGNDLGIAFQLMKAPPAALRGLYDRLVNPAVRQLGAELCGRGAAADYVVLTRRAHLVNYYSRLRKQVIRLRWRPDWHLGCAPADPCAVPRAVPRAAPVLNPALPPVLPCPARLR